MRSIILAVFFVCAIGLASPALQCSHKELDTLKDWIDMDQLCIQKMGGQVDEELKTTMQYMTMGAHISKDTVNRPGFADMFFKSESQEREHAIKPISYLLMRRKLTFKVSSLIKRNLMPAQTTWINGVSALRLQGSVTRKIRDVLKVCEEATSYNDYHLVDYLSEDFFEEQNYGQRDIAGKVSALEKMTE
ncbi:ferritin heavy chain-like [Leptinotarsa decemlineata]|uniref:ferritin heavy chain-like n=1 Tax=Leptinotarsa decemlineata TaxID=7539 RepID=UPI003D304ACB